MSNLTTREQQDLTRCEQVIQDGLDTVFEVAAALAEIRERKLYRSSHDTFEAYVKDRWHRTRQWAYNLIDTAEVQQNVNRGLQNATPLTSQRQARELRKLPAEEQPDAWREAVSNHGTHPTGRQVRQVVEQRLDPPRNVNRGLQNTREAKPARPVVEDAKVIDEQPREPKPPHPKKHTTPADADAEAFKKAAPYIYNLLKTNTKDIYGACSAKDFQALASRIIRRLEAKAKATRHVADDPPPLDAVLAFASEQDLSTEEAERFFYHHESTGWMAGRKWMTDWHAALRFWISNSKNMRSYNNGDNDKPRSYEIKDEIF